MPYVKAENVFGKGFSPMAKDCFNNENLGKNRSGLATTGLNFTKDLLIDKSKNGSTSKYGRSALQRAHPGWNV